MQAYQRGVSIINTIICLFLYFFFIKFNLAMVFFHFLKVIRNTHVACPLLSFSSCIVMLHVKMKVASVNDKRQDRYLKAG